MIKFDPATTFDFKPADYVPFKDRELCEKLRVDFAEVKNAITGFYEEQLRQLNAISIDSKIEDIPEVIANDEPEVEPVVESMYNEETGEKMDDISSFSTEESEPAEINFDIGMIDVWFEKSR